MLGYASFARAQATIKVGVLHSLSVADTKPLVGHQAVWNYSQSIKNTTNEECIQKWSASPTRRRVASSISRVSI